jgi:protease-4
MPLSVATTDDALAVFANPAGLGTNRDFNFYYLYNFTNENFWDNQTFLAQIGQFGLSYVDLKDFRIGWGAELTKGFLLGTTYMKFNNSSFWNAGVILRPNKYLSLGAIMQSIGQSIDHQYMVGIGARPLSNRYTITCDAYTDNFNKAMFGIELDPIDGIEIKGKINTAGDFSIQAGISLSKLGVGTVNNSITKKWAGYFRIDTDKRRALIKPPKQFLEMKLSGSIADQKPGFSIFGSSVTSTTYDILNTIKKAKEDKSITGLILKIEDPSISLALAQEIKSALDEFKKANKKMIVYSSQLGNIGYYLASGADEIITHPLGEIAIPGIAARSMQLKRAMNKLGVAADYERVGKYKSAPEMLSEDTLSSANREVINSMLDDYYSQLTSTIAEERKFTKLQFDTLVNQGFFLAKEAQEKRLIDRYCYEDELDSIIKLDNKNLKKITASHYMSEKDYVYDWRDLPKIMVIYATGDIVGGESGTDPLMGGVSCGANSIVKAIRNARKDKDVKAIILRVDSPGGDGFASDLIWREITIAKKTKPVIVSMGPVAASGGYYISMAADKIFASPATITGSIGAFSLKFVTKELYDKLGINTETIKRGEHADAFSQDRKFTDEEHDMLHKQIEDFYSQFIGKVAEYRHLTPEYVDSVGQGRVWTGNQARDRKLVDSLGGLLNAINYAKETAKVKEFKLDFVPKPRGLLIGLTIDWIKTFIKNNF